MGSYYLLIYVFSSKTGEGGINMKTFQNELQMLEMDEYRIDAPIPMVQHSQQNKIPSRFGLRCGFRCGGGCSGVPVELPKPPQTPQPSRPQNK